MTELSLGVRELHAHARRTPCRIAQQQKEIEALTATVKEQAPQIQKVNAQLELSKAAPQTVLNNQQSCRALPFFEIALVLVRFDQGAQIAGPLSEMWQQNGNNNRST